MAMIRCTRFLGHTWSQWTDIGLSSPVKGLDGELYRQRTQGRTCTSCNIRDVRWLPEYVCATCCDIATDDTEQAED